jgi:hypothetical protein
MDIESGFGEPPEAVAMPRLKLLCQKSSLEVMEKAVQIGINSLTRLRDSLNRANSFDNSYWIESIDKLLGRNRQKTIVGVVGTTGAGKSSIINAVLDEERYVFIIICISERMLSILTGLDCCLRTAYELARLLPQKWRTTSPKIRKSSIELKSISYLLRSGNRSSKFCSVI